MMPFHIINNNPSIFIHIPKNGGTLVKRYFDLQLSCHLTAQDFLVNLGNYDMSLKPNAKSFHLEELYRHGPLSPEEEKKLEEWCMPYDKILENARENQEHLFWTSFKFSFVRNPWDRLASVYHFHKEDFEGLGTFNNFMENLKHRQGPIFSPESTSILKLTQSHYLGVGPDYSFLTPQIKFPVGEAIIDLDYIGRYEQIAQGLKDLSEKFDMKYEYDSFPIFRRSDNSDQKYTKMYENFEQIYSAFQYYYTDIINFNYTFSGAPNCPITQECLIRYENEA